MDAKVRRSTTPNGARARHLSAHKNAHLATTGSCRDAAPRHDQPMPILARAEDAASNDSLVHVTSKPWNSTSRFDARQRFECGRQRGVIALPCPYWSRSHSTGGNFHRKTALGSEAEALKSRRVQKKKDAVGRTARRYGDI
jgi:hypothetical protein